MLAYSIDLVGLRELQAGMRKAPQIVVQELERATIEADLLIEREVQERMPTAQGLLRKSVFHEEAVSATGVLGVVGTPMNYAIAVELGTRPHFPPVDALIDWVKTKLGITSDKAARGAAFAIAKKISLRGTVGQFPFQLASIATEENVRAIFDQATDRIIGRLGSAS